MLHGWCSTLYHTFIFIGDQGQFLLSAVHTHTYIHDGPSSGLEPALQLSMGCQSRQTFALGLAADELHYHLGQPGMAGGRVSAHAWALDSIKFDTTAQCCCPKVSSVSGLSRRHCRIRDGFALRATARCHALQATAPLVLKRGTADGSAYTRAGACLGQCYIGINYT